MVHRQPDKQLAMVGSDRMWQDNQAAVWLRCERRECELYLCGIVHTRDGEDYPDRRRHCLNRAQHREVRRSFQMQDDCYPHRPRAAGHCRSGASARRDRVDRSVGRAAEREAPEGTRPMKGLVWQRTEERVWPIEANPRAEERVWFNVNSCLRW